MLRAEAHMGMQGATSTAIRLYKFNPKKKGIDSWELYAATVTPTFYDANEDSASGSPQWFLEAGELEVEVSDKFNFEESSKRATFAGESGIWALRFPSQQTFGIFVNQYNSKLFENTYKLSNDESNREKVCCLPSPQSLPVNYVSSVACAACTSDDLLLNTRLCCRSLAKTQSSIWAGRRQRSLVSSGLRT